MSEAVTLPMPWPRLRAALALRQITVTQLCNRAEVSQTYLRQVVVRGASGPAAERVRSELQSILAQPTEAA